jgi:hypothetical protein
LARFSFSFAQAPFKITAVDLFSKRQRQYLLAAATVCVVIVVIWLAREKFSGAKSSGGLTEKDSVTATAATPSATSPQRPRATTEPLPPIDPSKSVEAAQAEIANLSSQYDPSAVRPLAAYLYHTDPEVRSAARRGLMQLGEADAVPYLRAAEKQELDPAEAKELLEAAEFLAIPPMKIVPKVKEKK